MGVFTTRRLVWFAIFWMGYVHAINRESTFATGRLEPLEVDRADNQTGVAFAADLGGITSSDIGLGESQSRRIVTDDAVLLQGEMTFNRAVKKRVGEAVPPVDVATWRVVAEDLAEKRFGGNTSRAKGLRTLLAEAGGGAKDSMVDWQRLAYLLAGLRPLELLPKQLGPSYAFPTQHVAGHRSLDWPRVNQDAMIRQKPAFESYASFEAAWNEWTLLCIIGLCLIMLTSIITSTRRSQQPARTTLLLELETRWRLTGSGTAGSLALLRAAAKVSEEVPQSAGCSQEELSVWDGTVALFSTVIGTGLLAMPYAFSLAGMAAIPMTIFFVGCSAYTAHLMVWTMEAEASRQRLPSGCWRLREVAVDWGSLANAAFGKRAKYAVEAFLIVELWSYLLSSVVCAAMNVAQLFEQLDVNSSICICVVAAYGLTFVPAKTLTKVNVLSNFIFLLCCVMIWRARRHSRPNPQ
ncbi:unnamed protein product [Polarella glacialis]|uniref:Amino acid transporter transmembrane domain-containing protein n=1 Tax=Polarella glacialis TaxID=89957 RepID=A0A813EVT7_POLGL|nr:unnamed protein product [Polarella glacialis]